MFASEGYVLQKIADVDYGALLTQPFTASADYPGKRPRAHEARWEATLPATAYDRTAVR
jgi:hypothetical protein